MAVAAAEAVAATQPKPWRQKAVWARYTPPGMGVTMAAEGVAPGAAAWTCVAAVTMAVAHR